MRNDDIAFDLCFLCPWQDSNLQPHPGGSARSRRCARSRSCWSATTVKRSYRLLVGRRLACQAQKQYSELPLDPVLDLSAGPTSLPAILTIMSMVASTSVEQQPLTVAGQELDHGR